jgi:pantoate--beta-alanine ligase
MPSLSPKSTSSRADAATAAAALRSKEEEETKNASPPLPRVLDTVAGVRDAVREARGKNDQKIALVPTMGGLHQGHVSLISIALKSADFVVVSIYVNPMQFAPHEDFDAYPRTLEEDLKKIADLGENSRVCVFAPKESLFGKGVEPSECANVTVPGVSQGLCATTRPHFFGGVATVVLKLLNIVKPDAAVFGRKDYQQLKVIEKMVRDLDLDVEILSGGIVREPVNGEASDAESCPGLAMSSRNTYLTEKARKQAEAISVALKDVADGISGRSDEFTPAMGANMAQGWVGFIKRCIELSGGKVDYVEIRQRETLEGPVEKLIKGEKYVVLACAYFGGVRLLDNVEVDKA